MDAEKLAKRLLGLMEKSGIDEGEVYIQLNRGIEIVLRDQAAERLRNKETGGFGLRLIDDHKMAFVHSSDLRDESLERTVEQGVELARGAAPDESNSLVEPAGGAEPVRAFDDTVESIPYERKLNLLKDIETLCFAYDPAISKIEFLSYWDSVTDTVVANTKGVFQQTSSTRFSANVSVVAERDGDVETGGEESESRFFDDLDPPSKIASRACWKATALLGGAPVTTQAVPIVFDRDAGFALLIHLLSMINGGNVADGTSLLEDKIGDTIGSALTTVVDDPTLPGGVESRGFDAEGTPSRRTVILDNGVLKSFLFDAKSASKAGFTSTGNARRDSFRQLPSVGGTNFFLDKGSTTQDEIIRSTEKGLWVVSLAGWWVGINPSTGDFSSGAKGLWIQNGEVSQPVKNVTIASNVLDMLAHVDAVGDDLYFRHGTSCPTVRISQMEVGGI